MNFFLQIVFPVGYEVDFLPEDFQMGHVILHGNPFICDLISELTDATCQFLFSGGWGLKARMSLLMDGTLDFDCYSLEGPIWD